MGGSPSLSHENAQVPFHSKATTAITENNSSTPLLKLPLEIKNQIYELVCGGQLLHINRYRTSSTQSPESQFTTRICSAKISEQAADDLFQAESTAQWSVSEIGDRHKECIRYMKHPEQISTAFLATCRQVHNEARHMLYTTNTFAFSESSIVNHFISYLENSGYGHHLEIRRVHLDIRTETFHDEKDWEIATRLYLIPRLPEVHRISINLEKYFPADSIGPRTPAEYEACSPSECSRYSLMSAFLELGELPLRRVNFVISDKEFSYVFRLLVTHEQILPRWTLAEKQVWARYIKDSILRKDSQPATSSGPVVKTGKRDVSAELGKPGLVGG